MCVDGVCYPDEESARAAGALGGSGGGGYGDLQNLLKGADPEKPEKPENPETQLSRRLAVGYMDASDFTAFLVAPPGGRLHGRLRFHGVPDW